MKIRLSSFLTFFSKYIGSITVTFVTIIPIFATLLVFQSVAMIPVCFMSGLVLYLHVPKLVQLKSIYVDDKYIYISNFIRTIKLDREAVQYVQRDFLYFYVIILKNKCDFGQKIYFTTSIDYKVNVLFLLQKGEKYSLDEMILKTQK